MSTGTERKMTREEVGKEGVKSKRKLKQIQTHIPTHPQPTNSEGSEFSRPLTYLTVTSVAEALVRYNGMKSVVSKQLSVSPRVLDKFISNHPTLQEIERDVRESLLDEAETQLYSRVRDGDLQAIKFYLKCQGRHRNWVEISESNVNIQIPIFKYAFSKGAMLPNTMETRVLRDADVVDMIEHKEVTVTEEGKLGDS